VFNLLQLEERNRAFGMLDRAYEPVLKSMQRLDQPRALLIAALSASGHQDLAAVLQQKELTSAPWLIDVVVGPPKQLDFESDGRTGTVKFEVTMPDGKRKQACASIVREDINWRVKLPFTEGEGGNAIGVTLQETQAAVDKAVAGIKPVMEDLGTRLGGGEMIEDAVIRDRLTAVGRPLAAALQRMIYGQTSIK
jgi:hypothetical protein